MKTDIEKLSRKMPYAEPTDDFFAQMQANVLAKTVKEKQVIAAKEAKVFSINFKWMAAAAVVMIAGLTAFFGLNENNEVSIAQTAPIIDSVYKTMPETVDYREELAQNDTPATMNSAKTELKKPETRLRITHNTISKPANISDQEYVVQNTSTSDLDVEKVLAAFTPEQLKDIDRNSEQDVYLDLYN